jgi:thiamine transport system ATP-binding protein
VITVSHALYRYGTFKLAMDFTIPTGSTTAVLGPSGAGKTTLLQILAGFDRLTEGKLTIDGKNMTNASPAAFPVSMVFQDNNSFAHLDAWSNVALGVSPKLHLSEAEHILVDKALTRVGLKQLAHRKPGEMSGGERQRIALARVLVRNRPVLLLDEPFAALGPALRRDMLDLVSEFRQENGMTVVMVTHDPEDAKRIADMVMFVGNGQVNKPVPTPKFFLASSDTEISEYLGTGNSS